MGNPNISSIESSKNIPLAYGHKEDATPAPKVTKNLSEFRGTRMALDMNALIRVWKYMTNDYPHAFLLRALKFFSCLKENDIRPIGMFDGPSPIGKLVAAQRQKIRKEKKEKYDVSKKELAEELEKLDAIKKEVHEKNPLDREATSTSQVTSEAIEAQNLVVAEKAKEKIKWEKQSISLTKQDFVSLQKLMTYLGIPWTEGTHEIEADHLMAAWYHHKLVDVVFSEDSDMRFYGIDQTIYLARKDSESNAAGKKDSECNATQDRQTSEEEKPSKEEIQVSCKNVFSICQSLKLSLPSYQEMFILSEWDYCQGLNQIGAQRAFSIIQQFQSLDNFICPALFRIPLDRWCTRNLGKPLFQWAQERGLGLSINKADPLMLSFIEAQSALSEEAMLEFKNLTNDETKLDLVSRAKTIYKATHPVQLDKESVKEHQKREKYIDSLFDLLNYSSVWELYMFSLQVEASRNQLDLKLPEKYLSIPKEEADLDISGLIDWIRELHSPPHQPISYDCKTREELEALLATRLAPWTQEKEESSELLVKRTADEANLDASQPESKVLKTEDTKIEDST